MVNTISSLAFLALYMFSEPNSVHIVWIASLLKIIFQSDNSVSGDLGYSGFTAVAYIGDNISFFPAST